MSEVSSEAVEAAARALHGTTEEQWELLPLDVILERRADAHAALTAALPYLAAHQPARVAPHGMDVEHVIYKTLFESGASFESATVIPAIREAVLALFASQPTVAQVREQVARELEALLPTDDEVAGPQPCSAGHDCHEAARHVTVRRAQRIARGETKGGE